jgi:hypothetical protein
MRTMPRITAVRITALTVVDGKCCHHPPGSWERTIISIPKNMTPPTSRTRLAKSIPEDPRGFSLQFLSGAYGKRKRREDGSPP